MQIKSAPVSVKAVDADTGVFEAIVSVFGNKDSYGDVVMPGAFAKTLSEWEAKGDPIPVYWSHRMDDPDYNIGHVIDAREIDEGLWVKAQLDLGAGKADQVHRLLKGRRVTQFSFAYDVIEGGWTQREDDEYYELRELKLYEVGPTPIGANQETELLAVKAADVAAGLARLGSQLSKSHIDHLRSAQEAISAVLAEVEKQDQEKASGEAEAKSDAGDEEPAGAKSPASDEEPKSSPSARVLAAQSLLTLNGVH